MAVQILFYLFISYIISWKVWLFFYAYNVWDMFGTGKSCVVSWTEYFTEPFLLFPLLSSPFSSVGLQGYMLFVLFTWCMPLGIFSYTFMHREFQLFEDIVFQASKDSLQHLQSLYAHHTPAPTELVQILLMGDSLLIFPKCLENSLLVSPIILTFSYD